MIYASLFIICNLWEVIKRKISASSFGVELDGNICHWPLLRKSEAQWKVVGCRVLFVWVLFLLQDRLSFSLQAVDRANFEGPRGRMIFDHSGN